MTETPKPPPPDYEVGYGRPPVGSRFKPGQSGNPSGRPKADRSLATFIVDELNRPITVETSEGPQEWVMKRVVAKRMVKKAAEGNIRACELLERVDRNHARTLRVEARDEDNDPLVRALIDPDDD